MEYLERRIRKALDYVVGGEMATAEAVLREALENMARPEGDPIRLLLGLDEAAEQEQ